LAGENDMNAGKPSKLGPSPLRQGTLGFALMFALLTVADHLSMRYGLHGSERIVDDLLGGVVAGVLVFLYERRRLRLLTERLQVIMLMNHHIRNALQPIVGVAYESERVAHSKVIEECVGHIDWALREILPGKSEKPFYDPHPVIR
jgi:hypothetical protein